jgi:hypothetical protein
MRIVYGRVALSSGALSIGLGVIFYILYVLGIFYVYPLSWALFSTLAWLIPGIAIIFGIISLLKDEKRIFAILGLVLGLIGLILGIATNIQSALNNPWII